VSARTGPGSTARRVPQPASAPTSPARGVVGVPRSPAALPRPRQRPKQARAARPRRRGRFLQFVQMLLSIGLLVNAPIVAAVVAYGYGNGRPLTDDAYQLAVDLLRVVQSW
jgi:hypothetical protein